MTNRIKVWLKPPDQMDIWLATQGYYRKHTARDNTCLFRAVSEQVNSYEVLFRIKKRLYVY